MSSKESRIHKFILRAWTAASELDLSAMERLGVKVKCAEYVAEAEDGAMLALVQLDDKMRRTDLMKRLFGGESGGGVFPYNAACESAHTLSEARGVAMLVASGETKVEYQQMFAKHFVAESKGAAGEKKRPKTAEPPSEMCSMLDQWGMRFLERAKTQRDRELLALREENERLRKAAAEPGAEVKEMKDRIKDLETANAQLLEKKAAFDRLTLSYSSWCYDLKCKDGRITELEGELARMTERRDELVTRMERSRRSGVF